MSSNSGVVKGRGLYHYDRGLSESTSSLVDMKMVVAYLH